MLITGVISVAVLVAVLACLRDISALEDEVAMLERALLDMQKKQAAGDFEELESTNIANGQFV